MLKKGVSVDTLGVSIDILGPVYSLGMFDYIPYYIYLLHCSVAPQVYIVVLGSRTRSISVIGMIP